VFVAETAAECASPSPAPVRGVFRLPDMEKALRQILLGRCAEGNQGAAGNLNTDIHASAEYRAHLVTVMAQRAVEQALKN
jgi:carbon-monoxide dehydrogenase medium subunit